jgi:hypothetical protein
MTIADRAGAQRRDRRLPAARRHEARSWQETCGIDQVVRADEEPRLPFRDRREAGRHLARFSHR